MKISTDGGAVRLLPAGQIPFGRNAECLNPISICPLPQKRKITGESLQMLHDFDFPNASIFLVSEQNPGSVFLCKGMF